MQIFCERNMGAGTYDIYIAKRNEDGTRTVAKPVDLMFETIPDSHAPAEPTFRFQDFPEAKHFFQEMFDSLIKTGFIDLPDNTGELKATKEHLKDMQKITNKYTEYYLQ